MNDLDKFYSFVQKHKDGCWLWTGQTYVPPTLPYGTFTGKLGGKTRTTTAHRWIYMHRNGLLPKMQYVCHTCDNPRCVNLDHLFIGTPQENMADCVEKGRIAKNSGTKNGMAKLSESDIIQIRQMYTSGHPQKPIADMFGIHVASVNRIIRGARRGNSCLTSGPLRGSAHRSAKLSESDVVEIRKLAASGVMQKVLCSQYGISGGQMSQIINRNKWKHID